VRIFPPFAEGNFKTSQCGDIKLMMPQFTFEIDTAGNESEKILEPCRGRNVNTVVVPPPRPGIRNGSFIEIRDYRITGNVFVCIENRPPGGRFSIQKRKCRHLVPAPSSRVTFLPRTFYLTINFRTSSIPVSRYTARYVPAAPVWPRCFHITVFEVPNDRSAIRLPFTE
jgi:hypothetical protein